MEELPYRVASGPSAGELRTDPCRLHHAVEVPGEHSGAGRGHVRSDVSGQNRRTVRTTHTSWGSPLDRDSLMDNDREVSFGAIGVCPGNPCRKRWDATH